MLLQVPDVLPSPLLDAEHRLQCREQLPHGLPRTGSYTECQDSHR
jgi:hypothetical protein